MVDLVIVYTLVAASFVAVIAWYTWSKYRNERTVFGKRCKLNDFMLKDSVNYCNHGAYGVVPRRVIITQRKFQDEQESNPDGWFRYQLGDIYSNAVDKVAQFVGSDKENVVLVENASTATNTVIKSLKWSPGDKILVTNHVFEAVMKTAILMTQKIEGIEIVRIDIQFPIKSKQQLVDQLAKSLDANKGIKLAILDHITSVSAILMPLDDMIPVCHQRGVMVLVDGAHAPGQIKLSLDELGADFYAGNLHKWCFAARGCGILHVNPKHADIISPLVTSYSQFNPRMRDRFLAHPTRDYTSLCTPTHAIEFIEEIGMDAISKYNANMVEWAAEMLSNAWGTPRLAVHPDVKAPFMAVVKLPAGKNIIPVTFDGSDELAVKFYQKYSIHCAFPVVDGSFWARISAQIYNCKDDYLKLRDAVLDFVK